MARQLAANGSDVWLYFKTVPAKEITVGDDQLQKVLEFRTAIHAEQSFLSYEFGKCGEWEDLFRDHLYRWLDKFRRKGMIWPRGTRQVGRLSRSKRQEAISLLLAADADEDAQVEMFRKTALGDRLLRAAEIEPWIQQQASRDGPPTRWVRVPIPRENRLTAEPAGFSITPALTIAGTERPIGFALESLDYGVPEDNWSRCIPVALGGTLGQLRLISEELANSYGWQKAQAVLFVLTGATPIVEILSVEAHEHTLPALSRLVLTVDPFLPASEVNRRYTAARSKLFENGQLAVRHRDLALAKFVSAKSEGRLLSERLNAWNAKYPKWRYRDGAAFEAACSGARASILAPFARFGMLKLASEPKTGRRSR